jgi:hypothetical protein
MVPAQALVGLPTDMPGSDVIMPFIVEKAGGLNTFLVLEDVRGGGLHFHYTIFTVKSDTVYNDDANDTPYGYYATDAWGLISQMAPEYLDDLEITIDGAAYYAGYIVFENLAPSNSVIGQLIFMNAPAGKAAASNAWIKEFNLAVPAPMTDGGGFELFSANSLARAESLQAGAGYTGAAAFGLYPRYYINDAASENWLVIWKSTNAPAADLHIYFYDNDENRVSTNLPVPLEMNFIDVENYIPLALWAANTYPKQGWIAIETPDLNGNGFDGDREWAGYTYTQATGAANESWTFLTDIHRDVTQ